MGGGARPPSMATNHKISGRDAYVYVSVPPPQGGRAGALRGVVIVHSTGLVGVVVLTTNAQLFYYYVVLLLLWHTLRRAKTGRVGGGARGWVGP